MAFPALYLNTITINQASLKDKFRLAQASGYQGLEMWVHEVAPQALTKKDQIEAAERYRIQLTPQSSLEQVLLLAKEHHLTISGLCPGSDAAVRWHNDLDDEILESFEKTIEACHELGATYLVMPILGEAGSLEETAENFHRVGTLAQRYQIKLGLEPVGHINKCNRVGEALKVLELSQLGKHAGLVLDSFHFFRAGQNLDALTLVSKDQIVAVHINDAMDLPRESLFGHKHRVFPGEGIWDIAGFCRAVLEMGYEGHFVTEILNEDYWQNDAEMVCRAAHDKSREVLKVSVA